MPRAVFFTLVLSGWLAASAELWADPLVISLEAKAGKTGKAVRGTGAAQGGKPRARAVLDVKAGGRVTVTWTLRNADPKATFKDVLVHFFAVREKEIGQAAVPRLDQGVVVESALTVDLNPKDRTQGEINFVVEKPGFYLLCLETIGAAVVRGAPEYSAALDLRVK
jgi:hypothetical protein